MSDILLITANVGSLFDENTVIKEQWKEEIVGEITRRESKFVALHFQETGGKDYKTYSKDVVLVINDLFSLLKENGFSSLRTYLDIDYEKIDEYTALGTVIFVHTDWIDHVKQYKFESSSNGTYESLTVDETIVEDRLSDSIRKITKDQEIHEIEENTKSMDDMDGFLNPTVNNHRESLKRNLSAIEFRQKDDKLDDEDVNIVLRIEKKKFDYYDPQCFVTNWHQYREDDTEPGEYELKEFPIDFPPTYPWSEDPDCSDSYMKTRAPAWCDRVLMNDTAFESISQIPRPSYNCIGFQACMGDHKPVALAFSFL